MGRVDEARRRAEQAATGGQPVAAPEPVIPVVEDTTTTIAEDAESLSREPYPIEISERRRARPLAPVALPPAGTTSAEAPRAKAPESTPPPPATEPVKPRTGSDRLWRPATPRMTDGREVKPV